MVTVGYCPIVGGRCNKNEPEIRVQPDTFFLAEPFKPDEERKRREAIVKIVLTEEMKDEFCEKNLRAADKEPKEAIFCDVCRMIQSSAYGIADISGLNPNVSLAKWHIIEFQRKHTRHLTLSSSRRSFN